MSYYDETLPTDRNNLTIHRLTDHILTSERIIQCMENEIMNLKNPTVEYGSKEYVLRQDLKSVLEIIRRSGQILDDIDSLELKNITERHGIGL